MSAQELVDALARAKHWSGYPSDYGVAMTAGQLHALVDGLERAEQKSAELAAVIAEALAVLDSDAATSKRIVTAFAILSAAPADVLSAYTTRVREEAVAGEWEYAAQNGRGEIMHVGSEKHMRKLVASLGFPEAVAVVRRPKPGPWSEIPEGQN